MTQLHIHMHSHESGSSQVHAAPFPGQCSRQTADVNNWRKQEPEGRREGGSGGG